MADVTTLKPSLGPIGQAPAADRSRIAKSDGPGFKEALGQLTLPKASESVAPAGNLKFSSHAVDRMKQRGISYTPDEMSRMEKAIDKAAEKGSRETLLFTDGSAMIVSVKNRTVVTVMDKSALKENVFTNIDSTVVI